MKSSVLVIGSEGFLGRYICKLFHSKGFDVIGFDIKPIEDTKEYAYYFQKNIYELKQEDMVFLKEYDEYILINLSGVSRNGIAVKEPVESTHNTLTSYVHLLDLLENRPPKLLVTISTREVSMLEENYESLYGKTKLYSILKQSSELISNAYSEQWNIPLRIFRLSDIFGIGDHSSKVISIFFSRAKNNEDIRVLAQEQQFYLTEVSEVAQQILAEVDDLTVMKKQINLWSDDYVVSLLQLAYLAKELNPQSTSKILVDNDVVELQSVSSLFPSAHLEVFQKVNQSL